MYEQLWTILTLLHAIAASLASHSHHLHHVLHHHGVHHWVALLVAAMASSLAAHAHHLTSMLHMVIIVSAIVLDFLFYLTSRTFGVAASHIHTHAHVVHVHHLAHHACHIARAGLSEMTWLATFQ